MAGYPKRSPSETLKNQLTKADLYLARAARAAELLRLPRRRRSRIHALLGIDRCLREVPLCDVSARKEGAKILYDVIKGMKPHFAQTGMKVYHVTLVDEIGITTDRNPTLRLKALKRKVDKAIRYVGLSGIVFVEVQPLLNYPGGGEGCTLMLHAHALCWGVVSERKVPKRLKCLNNSRSWANQFGARPILARRLKDFKNILKIACYVSKLPHDGKYRSPNSSGEWRFRPTIKGYTYRLALRIAEGFSQYSIFDAVFSVAERKHIRAIWKRRLVDWHRARLERVEQEAPFDIPRFWSRLRRKHKSGYTVGFRHE